MNDLEWNRLADLTDEQIGPREEDIKFRIVAPMLRLLGFTDFDFSFETPADLGRIDITVKGFPVGVVIECKGPQIGLDGCVSQVEKYVRETMTRKHTAMLSMLTNGKRFFVYGVLGAIHKGELSDHVLLMFRRADLKAADTQNKLSALLSRAVVGGDAGDVRAAIESALRVKRDEEQTRRDLEIERAKLVEQIRKIDQTLGGLTSTVSTGFIGTTERPATHGNSSFRWSEEYGTLEDVCVWISDLLERLAPPESTKLITHSTLASELCAFLTGQGTDRAKSLTEEKRSKYAGNMIDFITANWTLRIGGKDCKLMLDNPGARVESPDAPDWLRQFTRVWTREKQMGKYAFSRRP